MKTTNSNMKTSNVTASGRSARRWTAGLLLAGLLGLGMRAHAATFALSPSSQSIPVGSTFTVTLITNLGTNSSLAVNAIQADLTYPSALLQLVSTDDTASPFTAWRQVTPSSGALSFVQAQPSPGLTGDNLAIAVIRFYSKAAGTASVQFNNATCAILLNSNNTNVYSASSGGSYVLFQDTTPPSISLTAPLAGSFLRGNAVAVSATATDNIAVTSVSFAVDGVVQAIDTATPYNWTWDTTAFSNGSHQLTAIAYDAMLNSSTTTVTVTVDNAAPTVAISTPINGSTVSGSAVTVSATASDNIGVAGVQFKLDGVNLSAEDTASPYSITWNSTLASNGSHSLTAVVRDAAGNTSTSSLVSVTVDNAAPVISAVSASSLFVTSAAITWNTDELADSQISYGLTNALGTSTTLDSTMVTSHSVLLSGLTANTTYFFVVKSRDASGNLAVSSTSTFKTLVAPDTTAPTVSITAPANGSTVSGSAVTVSANASDNIGVVGVQFKLDGVNLGAEDTATPYSISWNSTAASNGSHNLTAVARDAAGNTSTSTIVSVTVDNAAPTVAILSPANGATVGGTVTISGTAADNIGVTQVQVSTGGVTPGVAVLVGNNWTYTWNTSGQNGARTITATARDAAGNSVTSSSVSVTLDNTGPVISAVTSGSITCYVATINWTTDENSDSQVQFGLTTSYGNSTTLDARMLQSHSAILSGLSANTLYHFRVISKDALGNSSTSPDFTFTTHKIGDVNGDGLINLTDLSMMMSHWNATGNSYPAADFYPLGNPDGTVNASDLSAMMSNWGL